METVGSVQSETEATATTAEAASTFDDFLSDDEFDAIFAAADKERESSPTTNSAASEQKQEGEGGKLEREEKRQDGASEREQNREKTIEQLVSHFGSQEFVYTEKYRGTVTQMIAICPAIDAVLDEGFEYVRDWLEPHKATEEEKPKEAEEDTIEDPKPDENSTDKKDTKAPVIETSVVAAVVEKAKPSSKVVSGAEAEPQLKAESESKEKANTSPEASSSDATEVPDSHIDEAPTEVVIEAVSDKEIISDETPEAEIANVQTLGESTETAEIDGEAEADASPALLVEDLESEVVSKANVATDKIDEPRLREELADDFRAIDDKHIDLTEILEEEREEEFVQHAELSDSANQNEVIETSQERTDHFDAWLEIAKDEPPLDDLFIAIADQLEADFEQTDEAQMQTDSLAYQLEDISDEELVLSNQPEVFAVNTAIRSARKSVEALYTARTKEECKFYVEQIVVELSIVLRSLGYDNPEVIIRSFLSSHSPESLKNLITELEASLRRSMVREIQQRRAGHAKNRHTRLSKFVGFIMQALSPSSGRIAESA